MIPSVHIKSPAVIILAAGKAERFGSAKLLKTYMGKSILGHAVEAAIAVASGRVVVVTGAWREEVEKELEGCGVRTVFNAHFAEGMATSIHAGIRAITEAHMDVDGAFILVGDQPFVDDALLGRMALRQEMTRLPIVASHYGDVIGTPVLFHKMMFPRLLELKGDKGARGILQDMPEQVATVLFPDGETDIDTTSDYEKLLKA